MLEFKGIQFIFCIITYIIWYFLYSCKQWYVQNYQQNPRFYIVTVLFMLCIDTEIGKVTFLIVSFNIGNTILPHRVVGKFNFGNLHGSIQCSHGNMPVPLQVRLILSVLFIQTSFLLSGGNLSLCLYLLSVTTVLLVLLFFISLCLLRARDWVCCLVLFYGQHNTFQKKHT